jgi:hypothetical protein
MFKEKSLIDDLTGYIKKNLKKGYTRESLRWALVNQGYSKMEVDKAIKKSEQELAAEAPILKTKPEIKYEVVEPTQERKKGFWKKLFGV